MRERFQAQDPRSLMFRFHTQSAASFYATHFPGDITDPLDAVAFQVGQRCQLTFGPRRGGHGRGREAGMT